jgi:hypothetical protein
MDIDIAGGQYESAAEVNSLQGLTGNINITSTNITVGTSGNDVTLVAPSATSNVTEVANASDTELTTTTATTVATFTPTAQGNFIIDAYFRVVTASTTVTLTASWTDGSGSQTYTWVNATSEPVGSYHNAPLYLNATTGSAITITATAGTANQVYVSGTIIKIT